MELFDFEVKTKLFFGNSRENEIGKILKSYNFSKVVLLIGQNSVRSSGLLDRVINSLKSEEVSYILLEGIRPNPTIQFVYSHLSIVRDFKPDCLLAIGGGSVIDTAKNMACAYYDDGDSFEFNLHIREPKKTLPIGVILTIAASGSEMSTSCVIQDDEKKLKSGFNSELVRPLFVVESPELTYSVTKLQTAYGIVDILMHTLERYFSYSSEFELADSLSEGLLREVISAGEAAYNDPTNYEARKTLMIASSVSHSGYTSICKKYKMPVHQLEHVVSALYPEVSHAAGLAVIWPRYAMYYLDYDLDKFDRLSRNVFHSFKENKRENALHAIECMKTYFNKLNMPKTFKDLGIENPNIDKLVEIFSKGGTRKVDHHSQPLDKNIAYEIFKACI